MSGSQTVRTDLPGHAKKRLELHIGIAVGAGDGCAAREILFDKRAHNALFELLFKIHNVVGKIQVLRDPFGIVNVVERAATVLRWPIALKFRQAALIPQLHRETNDGAALSEQDSGDGGRIHAPGHGHGDQTGLNRSGRRQRIKLGLR
jgi:hypothetical protein